MTRPFQYGDRVEKVQGYPWTGTVQAVFTNRKAQVRVVVELWRGFDGDALHIFNAEQIRHVAAGTNLLWGQRTAAQHGHQGASSSPGGS